MTLLTPADATGLFSGFRVFACRQSAADVVPEGPGVYAFYRKLAFAPENVLASLQQLISSVSKKPHCSIELPWRITIDLFSKSEYLDPATQETLGQKDEATTRQLSEILFKFSILTRPWYVGATSSLRRRFRDHLESGFIQMMEKAPYNLVRNDFLFLAFATQAHLTDELESLFIQLGNPIFNVQRR